MKTLSFTTLFLEADGEEAGKLELTSTPFEKAYQYAKSLYPDIDSLIPDFENNYRIAQQNAKRGWTKRKDMPVIRTKDVKELQKKLNTGELDVHDPSAPENRGNKFPEKLSGARAKSWMVSGLRDGDYKDDVVDVINKKVRVRDLFPIQEQIYVDKALKGLTKTGSISSTVKFLTSTKFITSNDKYIIDGHHRYLTAFLIDPNMKVNTIAIDLPINILLKLTVAYGDAVGNKRNQ